MWFLNVPPFYFSCPSFKRVLFLFEETVFRRSKEAARLKGVALLGRFIVGEINLSMFLM